MTEPSCSGPRTASDRHDAARHGPRSSPAPHGPGRDRRRTAGAVPGKQPGPGASADRSHVVPRSAAHGPAHASPPPRSGSPAGGATSASRASATPACKNPPRPCRAGCRSHSSSLIEDYILRWTPVNRLFVECGRRLRAYRARPASAGAWPHAWPRVTVRSPPGPPLQRSGMSTIGSCPQATSSTAPAS